MTSAPYFPMALLVAMSSSYILSASFNGSSLFNTLSTAQNKLTAVGLAALISSAALSKSTLSISANAIPKAADTPIAGAPRTVIFLIAVITS